MQIRLRWRAKKRKYKMSDSKEDVMLIRLYVISNKKKNGAHEESEASRSMISGPWQLGIYHRPNVNLAKTL